MAKPSIVISLVGRSWLCNNCLSVVLKDLVACRQIFFLHPSFESPSAHHCCWESNFLLHSTKQSLISSCFVAPRKHIKSLTFCFHFYADVVKHLTVAQIFWIYNEMRLNFLAYFPDIIMFNCIWLRLTCWLALILFVLWLSWLDSLPVNYAFFSKKSVYKQPILESFKFTEFLSIKGTN